MSTKQPVSNKSSSSSNKSDNLSLTQKQKAAGLFQELNKFLAVRDYRQVLKVTNKILHTDGFRENFKLAKCKCSALIKMGRYDEVSKFISSLNGELASKLAFEEAYSLYRLFKNEEAMVALNKGQIDDEQEMIKINDLRAQILYRLEDFSGAKDLYKKLLREGTDELEEDRENNLLACEAAMSVKNSKMGNGIAKKVKVSKLSVDTPDAFFNRAIVHIGNGDFAKAEKSLNNAKAVLESYDDLEPEELEQDLHPILIQLALVNQELGHTKLALKQYQNVLKMNQQTDLLTASVINNNILALNQTHNLFDSKKKIKALQTKNPDLVKKLQSTQVFVMELNKVLVNVHASATVEARKLLEELKSDFHKYNYIDAILAEVALLQKEEKIDQAIAFLKENILKSGASEGNLEKMVLALAQIKFSEAVDFLNQNFSMSPTILALNLAKNKDNHAYQSTFLSQAEPNWQNHVEFAKIYGEHLLSENNNLPKALEIYKYLSEQNDQFLPKFIQIAAKIDPEASKLAAEKLETTENLIQGIDVNLLEETAGVAGSRYARKLKEAANAKKTGNSNVTGDGKEGATEKGKKKRKRKPKLPKNLNKEIDDERWLPLKDRSYYRGKKAYKNKRSGKMIGAQGSANYGKETKVLDASKDDFKGNTGGGSSNAKKSKNKGGKKGKGRKR